MYCEIKYMKYDAKNIIFGSGKKALFLSFIIAIGLIILVNFYFNNTGLLIFGFLSWLIYLIPSYNKAKKYCNR